MPCAPIHSVPEALAHPQVRALGILAPIAGEDFSLTALPLSIDGQRPLPHAGAPRLGADNAAHGLPVPPRLKPTQETS